MHTPLILQLAVFAAHQVTANASLEVGKDLGEFLLAHLFQLAQHASLEEHLRVPDAIVVAEIQRGQNFLRRHFAVDEPARNRVRSQN